MDYMECLGASYPTVFASCVGDSTMYGNIVWESGDPLPTEAAMIAMNFNNVRNVLISGLSDACQNAIMSGFPSSALGSPHQYASGQLDQINLIGATILTAPTPANPNGNGTYYKCAPITNAVVGAFNYYPHSSAQM